MKRILILILIYFPMGAYAMLAGGRPNAFSEGQNAFAGVVNPANAVWVPDRIDIGAFYVNQKVTIDNKDGNPFFPSGKIDYTHKCRNLFTMDAAVHKHFRLCLQSRAIDTSFTLAWYAMPAYISLRTKDPIPLSGTTPTRILNRTDILSSVFSFKINECHSIGFSVDCLYYSHKRNGFQNADHPLRSVSPGNVTNNGMDHCFGVGCGIGWRWNITGKLNFGAAWTRKSYCGQYRKYRGFEPHHAKNYSPQTIGAGFSYKFTTKFAGRIEVLWMNLGNLPGANNNILPDGALNTSKRGSSNSPGPGLNDATYINLGMGYRANENLSFGAGYSHRIKLKKKNSSFVSHTYMIQTIFDTLSLGANCRIEKHDLFFTCSYGFKSHVSGEMPPLLGGGLFRSEKQYLSFSFSWGYLY